MKIHSVFFGILILTLASVQLGLSPTTPILILLGLVLLMPLFNIAWAALVATYRTIKYVVDMQESFKKTASLLTVKEDLSALRTAFYKDESTTYILNNRSAVYEKLFKDLKATDPTSEFDLKSHFAFGNNQQLVHTIQAKNPSAEKLLTMFKNRLLAAEVDIEFS